ncbi:MAG: DUF4352 domain-containing protein [Myxococcales bacterium]|nr:DUF4352 domain-containing protein [Myxococcales bacterium]
MKVSIALVAVLGCFSCTSESVNNSAGGAAGVGSATGTGGGGGVADSGLAGAGGTVAQDASTPIHKLNETAHAADYDLSITGMAEAAEDSGACPIPYYFMPPAGKVKLGVEVQIVATTNTSVNVNPFYAKLTDSTGYAYTSTFGGCEPELKSVKLAPGETAKGWITFELPATSVGLTFIFNPLIVGNGNNEVKFDLGQ